MRLAAIFALAAIPASAHPPSKHPAEDPGRVTARRLNRYEYNNTIRDLLAVDFEPAADFPADDSGYGFDNIGDVLSLSPVLMEKYLAAAEKIARAAIVPVAIPKPTAQRHTGADNIPGRVRNVLTVAHRFPVEGDYEFLINLNGRPDPAHLLLAVDGRALPEVQVVSAVEDRRSAQLRAHVPMGEHILAARPIPDGPHAPDSDFESGKSARPESEPSIGAIEIRGPYNPVTPPPSESYRRIFTCSRPGERTIECARADLANLASRAYRRPVTRQEVDGLVRFVEMALRQGDGFEQGIQVAVEAILVSPHFLFRIERDRDPTDAQAAHQLTDFELATRLSYFLWSSMPDQQLFHLAAKKKLHNPKTLEAQVRRMLADPKSKALVENFGGQWLQLRNLDTAKPDPDRFPLFTPALRRDMKRETELFFESIIHQDRSILDFLDADYTFLNGRLAAFYGIPRVGGSDFQRVDLSPEYHRGGVLTQASVLTVSSYPNRTSPVIRGKWILENLLNTPPPPPPPNVPNLDEKAIGSSASLREQLEQHRANPACRGCHARMDPLGFSLENYDAIGRWRTEDGKFPIDADGRLPNGRTFDGALGLKEILLADKPAFTRCLAEKLLTYALGRGLEDYDRTAVQSIVDRTVAAGYKFSALILQIVQSVPFRERRGEPDAARVLVSSQRTP